MYMPFNNLASNLIAMIRVFLDSLSTRSTSESTQTYATITTSSAAADSYVWRALSWHPWILGSLKFDSISFSVQVCAILNLRNAFTLHT